MINSNVSSWVRAEKYCEDSGEPMSAILDRIRNGEWAAGKHYKRTGPRTLWINRQGVEEWINLKPHVESFCPQVSRAARGNQATGSA